MEITPEEKNMLRRIANNQFTGGAYRETRHVY